MCVPEIGAKDIDAIVDFAKSHAVDFAVVAPDDPLALGCVDRLHEAGIPCFGPDAKAARIESSKVFSKNLMHKYHIPTASYQVFDDPAKALSYLRTASFPIVVKADGLALGKGVLIPQNLEEAEAAVKTIMEDRAFGDSGREIVVEEFLTGPEVSVLAFTDGTAIVPMVSSMDHKRAGDGDTGLNTGGMGTVAPNPYYTLEIRPGLHGDHLPAHPGGHAAEGCPFKGCLYFGLMLTPDGPKVIESQLPLRRSRDPGGAAPSENRSFDHHAGSRIGTLADLTVEWSDGAAACVILASGGYPSHYEKGLPISFPSAFPANVTCYHAGDKLTADGTLVTSGGRVLGITATAATLAQALSDAYAAADTVAFSGKYMRRDIGQRAMRAMEG